jgi:hypothetical protein
MTHVTKRYSPVVVGVNSTVISKSANAIGGFLAVTAGTITLSNNSVLQATNESFTIISAMPVTAGTWYELPFITQGGYTFTTAGGASGVLAVG